MSTAILILTNVPDLATGREIAARLIDERAAACVNLLPGIESIYRWQGQVERADEVTLLIKTLQSQYPLAEQIIKAMHPYELPEVIALPLAAGLPEYLGWIANEVGEGQDDH